MLHMVFMWLVFVCMCGYLLVSHYLGTRCTRDMYIGSHVVCFVAHDRPGACLLVLCYIHACLLVLCDICVNLRFCRLMLCIRCARGLCVRLCGFCLCYSRYMRAGRVEVRIIQTCQAPENSESWNADAEGLAVRRWQSVGGRWCSCLGTIRK